MPFVAPVTQEVADLLNQGQLWNAVATAVRTSSAGPTEVSQAMVEAIIANARAGNAPHPLEWLNDYLALPPHVPIVVVPLGVAAGSSVEVEGAEIVNLNGEPVEMFTGSTDPELPTLEFSPQSVQLASLMLRPDIVIKLIPVIAGLFAAGVRVVAGGISSTRSLWSRMNPITRQVVLAAGVAEGTDVLIPGVDLPSPSDIPGWLDRIGRGVGGVGPTGLELIGGRGLEAAGVGLLGTSIIGGWVANGMQFYRLNDGRLAVVRRNGSIKIWRPRKPIVIFSDGAGNLRTFLRAESAMNRQSKRLEKALRRRRPRQTAKKPRTIILESGKGGVQVVE